MSLEPWLIGGLEKLDPVQAAVLYSFEQAMDDIDKWTGRLPADDLWAQYGSVASVGWHVRHIAGSVDRLTTYAAGAPLSKVQLAALDAEGQPGDQSRAALLSLVDETFNRCGEAIRALDPSAWRSMREVGRKRVPVPLGVLLAHIAEHTQRHVGEVIVTVKLIRGDWR